MVLFHLYAPINSFARKTKNNKKHTDIHTYTIGTKYYQL